MELRADCIRLQNAECKEVINFAPGVVTGAKENFGDPEKKEGALASPFG